VIEARTPPPSGSRRAREHALNGHVSQSGTPHETKTERTRLQDRPNISFAELAAMQRGYVERLGKLIEQRAAVMNRPNPPTAAIGSPAPAREPAVDNFGCRVWNDERLGKLTRTVLSDGSTSYGLRTDVVRSAVAKVLGAPLPAFVERGAATNSPYLEVVGTKDREIAAAMASAAQRWGNDERARSVSALHRLGFQHCGQTRQSSGAKPRALHPDPGPTPGLTQVRSKFSSQARTRVVPIDEVR
jgi:hypothetical protein